MFVCFFVMWAIKSWFRLLVANKNLTFLSTKYFPTKTYYRDFEWPLLILNRSLFRRVYISFTMNFHTSSTRWEIRVQQENLAIHEIMENIGSYSDTVIVHPSKRVRNKNLDLQVTVRDVFKKFYLATFHNLKDEQSLEDDKFMGIVSSLVQAIPSGSFLEIQTVLFCLCLWQHYTKLSGHNFKLLGNTLDYVCTSQLQNWSVTQKLLIADYLFHLHLIKNSAYNKNMIISLLKTSNHFTNSQFVHLMFCVSLQKDVPQYFLDTLDKQLEEAVNTVSMEELSIVCFGYFKADYKINDKSILKIILKRTTSDINNLDSRTISRFLKFLRKSFHHQLIEHYIPLLKGCTINMKRWNLLTAVHTSLLCSATCIFEPFLLDVIVEKVKDNIATTRLKDICKVVQSLSRFNYTSHSEFHEILFCKLMTADKIEEARQFPRDLLQLLLFYIYMGHFPINLIEHVLNPDFVGHCQRTFIKDLPIHLAVIDYCVAIECDKYFGPRLKPELLNVLKDNRGNFPNGNTKRNNSILAKLLENVTETLRSFTTPDNYTVRHVLPHMFNPVIIIKLSSTDPTPLQQISNACPSESILSPPTNELWGCLVMCGPFSFAYKSRQLCALMVMKVRQLKKLGYKVVLIPSQDFPTSDRSRKSYLKKKLDLLGMDIENSLLSTTGINYQNYH